jgi:peptidylprolyl isomerase
MVASLGVLALVAVGCGRSRVAAAGASQAPPPPIPSTPAATAPPAAAPIAVVPADAERSPTGLAWRVLKKSADPIHPGASDRVVVAYTGWTAAGQIFDSTDQQGKPATFPMSGLIRGWAEGVARMVRGEKRRLWIPSALAYGDAPTDDVKTPAGPLTFDVELLDVLPAPEVGARPADLTPVPRAARKTASGLAYRVLHHGSGQDHPRATSTVEVNYTGWRADGRMLDSSALRGQPATLALANLVKGWSEGVQLMVVGDKARFWIPGKLAYGERALHPGARDGMLVFDVELLAIK